jgi:hypothetical protein
MRFLTSILVLLLAIGHVCAQGKRALTSDESKTLLSAVSEMANGVKVLDASLALVDGYYDARVVQRDKPTKTQKIMADGAPKVIAALEKFRSQIRNAEAALWVGPRYPEVSGEIVAALGGPPAIINRLDMTAEEYLAELRQLAAISSPIPPELVQLTISRLGLSFSAAVRDAQIWRADLVERRLPAARRDLSPSDPAAQK